MTSKNMRKGALAVAACGLLLWAAPTALAKDSSLYPNDFGPAEIDVSQYPKPHREAYRLFAFKCAACHTIARPINSQFLELTKEEEKKARAKDPDFFTNDKIVKAEERVWARYVKRMMAKPGCPIKGEDGKKIYEFLVFDSKIRKMGANAKAWQMNRAKLIGDFKKKYPDAYEKIYGAGK